MSKFISRYGRINGIPEAELEDMPKSDLENYKLVIDKIQEGKRIFRKVIRPLEEMIEFIDDILILKHNIIDYIEGNKNNNENKLNGAKIMLKKFGNLKKIEEIISGYLVKGKLETKDIIEILSKIIESEKTGKSIYIKKLFEILFTESENLTLEGSYSSESGDIPSFDLFVETIKYEILSYLESIPYIDILGDENTLVKVEIGCWLLEERENSYVKLPYFENNAHNIIEARRNKKIGQVVIKGPAGLGKTRIFEFLGNMEKRPYRIISMHQYINFYDLMVQRTNLSPTKNQIDLINDLYTYYESRDPESLLKDIVNLFEANKKKFPSDFSLRDFLVNIFDVSKATSDKSIKPVSLSDEDINDPIKVKEYILKCLRLWKDEKIFNLLINKKEIIKGDILQAMEAGEKVVLDEIDKIEEKNVEGILAFLDFERGREYSIQGFENPIYIPERFEVYATSNDNHKPSGPLGRRFNNIYMDYFDKENLTLYILSKIVNKNLRVSFSRNEIEQINNCIDIISKLIEENRKNKTFNLMDFSIRMIDNFVNGFISVLPNGQIERKTGLGNQENYIYIALKRAFEMQIEDFHGQKQIDSEINSEIGEQKEKIISSIETLIKKNSNGNILRGRKISKSKGKKLRFLLSRFDYDNTILESIVEQRKIKSGKNNNTRIINYSDSIASLFRLIDNNIRGILEGGHLSFGDNLSTDKINGDFNTEVHGVKIEYNEKNHELILTSTTGEVQNYIATKVFFDEDKNILIIDSGDLGFFTKKISKEGTIEELIKEEYVKSHRLKTYFKTNEGFVITVQSNEDIKFLNEMSSISIPINSKYSIVNKTFLTVIGSDYIEVILLDKKGISNTSYKDRAEKFGSSIIKISYDELGVEEGESVADIGFDSTREFIYIDIQNNNDGKIVNTIIVKI